MNVLKSAICIAFLNFLLLPTYGSLQSKEDANLNKEEGPSVDERVREADIFLARGEYYPALIKYLEASKLEPKNAVIFNKLGIVYSQLQLHKEALSALNKSIALDKKYAYSYNNLGSLYFSMKDLKHAEKNFKRALKLNSKIASFHLNLGTTFFEKKEYKKGLEEYRKALGLDSEIFTRSNLLNLKAPSETLNNPVRNYTLARIYASLNDVERAIKYLQLAFEHGGKVLDLVANEKDFDPMRDNPLFVEFLEELRVRQFIGK